MAKANSSESSTANSNPSAAHLSLEPPTPYICTLCFRTFISPQALGGHQNAHRREKREAKRLYVKKHLSFMRNSAASSQPLPRWGQLKPVVANGGGSGTGVLFVPEQGYGLQCALGLPSTMPEIRCHVPNLAANQETSPVYNFLGLSKRESGLDDAHKFKDSKEEGVLDLTLKL